MKLDFTELRKTWAERRANAEAVRRRIDPQGATRPARDPDEAAFLESIGRPGVFSEVELPGWREWLDYRDLPTEKQDPPGLTAADFAASFIEQDRLRREADGAERAD
ncbi:hypothetical protein [Longimicrobium sp.]|uniref:hypothetical protein n=1 Tax=Longimicrobium sp. TaxID=2029185 RepID=UPI002E34D04D|nr:hypothetical protein [Longimicrobium sp.]HEX6039252.1 hypothetical protein [Longimicrobium sp.]